MTFGNTLSLCFILLLIPMVWVWRRSLVDQDSAKKNLSLVLRLLGFIALVVALCRPYLKQEINDVHVVYLVDSSQSIDPESLRDAQQWIDDSTSNQGANDSSDIFMFGTNVRKLTSTQLKQFSEQAIAGTTESEFRSATPISKALLAMRTVFPTDKAKRLVILTDARNTGTLSAGAVETLNNEGVEVVYHPLDPLQKPEVAVASLSPSTNFAYQGEMLRLSGSLISNCEQTVEARLLNRGIVVARQDVKLVADEQTMINFDAEMHTAGASQWSLEIIPKEDFFASNNSASTTIKVKGLPRFLVIHEDEKQMRPFVRAMKKQGVTLELRGEHGIPHSFNELLAYDGLILANVSAVSLSTEQMENISRYVTDFGGGLLMLGSENSYGLGGYFKSPVEDVLPLTSRYEKEKQKPSLAMVLVIDKSGSMSGTPIAMARASAMAAAELLSPNDQIAVIGFDGSPQLICPLTSASDQASIQGAISSLAASGGTNLYPAMVEGRNILQEATAKIKHMIILSDGQTQEANFQALTQEMANEQMTISTVALGSGAAKDLMQQIANEGMGRYYATNDPQKMPQIFTKETMKASRSSIKEDLFSSLIVGDHPVLNGYEGGELPFVLGYVMTRPKPTAQVLLAAETGDPLLAISRYGLGIGAAYTSDLTEKWGGEWLSSATGPPFWAQTLRAIARKEESAGLTSKISHDGERLTINAQRRDDRGESVELVPWDIKATDKSGKEVSLKLTQNGLGSYQGSLSTESVDSLNIRLHDKLADLTKSINWQRDYPKEYKLTNTTDSSITSLSQPNSDAVFANISPTHSYKNASWMFVFLGFTLILGGLVLRRL